MSCRKPPRRPCASLPRRRASAAELAEIREDIEALDRCLRDADQVGELALGRANALGRVLAEHLSPDALQAAGGRTGRLHVIPGGAA